VQKQVNADAAQQQPRPVVDAAQQQPLPTALVASGGILERADTSTLEAPETPLMVRPIENDGSPAIDRFRRALGIVASIVRTQSERYPVRATQPRSGGSTAQVGAVDPNALRIALLDERGAIASLSTAADTVDQRRFFSRRVLHNVRLMVGNLGAEGALCARHFTSVFTTSRNCWATDSWSGNYRSWAHAAAGALLHRNAGASVVVGARHITIALKWHAQVLPVAVARAATSEDHLATVQQLLMGRDVFRTGWCGPMDEVKFEINTFGVPIYFEIATLAAAGQQGGTAACQMQIEEAKTLLSEPIAGKIVVPWRTFGEWTGTAPLQASSYTSEKVPVRTSASSFTIRVRHLMMSGALHNPADAIATAGIAIFRAAGCMRAPVDAANATGALKQGVSSRGSKPIEDPQWLNAAVTYDTEYYSHIAMESGLRPVARGAEKVFTLAAMLEGDHVFRSARIVAGQAQSFVVSVVGSDEWDATRDVNRMTGLVPRVVKGEFSAEEFKKIVRGEGATTRAAKRSKVVRIALATPSWDSSRYEAQVEEFDARTNRTGAVLLPWSEYGRYDGAHDGLTAARSEVLATFAVSENLFLPVDYTPDVIEVKTTATSFKVSVRHSFRGLAPSGLAVFRLEGYGELHAKAREAERPWTGWVGHVVGASGQWFYRNKSTGAAIFFEPENSWVRLDMSALSASSMPERGAHRVESVYYHTGTQQSQKAMPHISDLESSNVESKMSSAISIAAPRWPSRTVRRLHVMQGKSTLGEHADDAPRCYNVEGLLLGERVWYTSPMAAHHERSFVANASGARVQRLFIATFHSPSTWVKVEEIDVPPGTPPLCDWTEMGTFNGNAADDPNNYTANHIDVPSGALAFRVYVRHAEDRYESAAGLAIFRAEGWSTAPGEKLAPGHLEKLSLLTDLPAPPSVPVRDDGGFGPSPLKQIVVLRVEPRRFGEVLLEWNRLPDTVIRYIVRGFSVEVDGRVEALARVWYFTAKRPMGTIVKREKHVVAGLGTAKRVRFTVAPISTRNVEGEESYVTKVVTLPSQSYPAREICQFVVPTSERSGTRAQLPLDYAYKQYSVDALLRGDAIYLTEALPLGTETHFEFEAKHFEVKRFVLAGAFTSLIATEILIQEVEEETPGTCILGRVIVPWTIFGVHRILQRASSDTIDRGDEDNTVDALLRGSRCYMHENYRAIEQSFNIELVPNHRGKVVNFHLATLRGSDWSTSEMKIEEMTYVEHSVGRTHTGRHIVGREVVQWGVYGRLRPFPHAEGDAPRGAWQETPGAYLAERVPVHTHAEHFRVTVRTTSMAAATSRVGLAILQAETLSSFVDMEHYIADDIDVETTASHFRVGVRAVMNCVATKQGVADHEFRAGIGRFVVQGVPRSQPVAAATAKAGASSLMLCLTDFAEYAHKHWHTTASVWSSLLRHRSEPVERARFSHRVGILVWSNFTSLAGRPMYTDRCVALDFVWQAICNTISGDAHLERIEADAVVRAVQLMSDELATGRTLYDLLNRNDNHGVHRAEFARCISIALVAFYQSDGVQLLESDVMAHAMDRASLALKALVDTVGCREDGGIDATMWASWFARKQAQVTHPWWKTLGIVQGSIVGRVLGHGHESRGRSEGDQHIFREVTRVGGTAEGERLTVEVESVGPHTQALWHMGGWVVLDCAPSGENSSRRLIEK
jgi:hypothetical protein